MSEEKKVQTQEEQEQKPQMKWYVLRAISGKEKKVKEYIELEKSRNPELAEYVGRVLVPTQKVIQFRRGKKVTKEKTLYPGYVYVEAALVGEVPHILRNIPNVITFVGADKGKTPIPLKDEEVKVILSQADQLQESGEVLEQEFHVGDTVKVIDGPFAGFTGEVQEVNTERKKLKIIVKIFERTTPIELKFTQVEKES